MPDTRQGALQEHRVLTDDELLDGLWWGDPEWPPFADGLWRHYVQRMHEWNAFKKSVATVLRSLEPIPTGDEA